MDIKQLLKDVAIAAVPAAVNGGDTRLDAVILLLQQILVELRLARAEREQKAALEAPTLVDVTQHSTNKPKAVKTSKK